MPAKIRECPQRPKGTNAKQLARDLCIVAESVRQSRGVLSTAELRETYTSVALLFSLRLAESRR